MAACSDTDTHTHPHTEGDTAKIQIQIRFEFFWAAAAKLENQISCPLARLVRPQRLCKKIYEY